MHKKDVLILGAGRCGTALGHLLEAEFSPYRVVGFLDDDPAKQGKVMGSPKVIGSTDRFKEIASKMGVNTAILAITHDRPSGRSGRSSSRSWKNRSHTMAFATPCGQALPDGPR